MFEFAGFTEKRHFSNFAVGTFCFLVHNTGIQSECAVAAVKIWLNHSFFDRVSVVHMTLLRNILVIVLVLGLLGCGLWFLFIMPGQVDERFRSVVGKDVCKDWSLRGLKQADLTTFTAGKIIINADPVLEERDMLVLTEVSISAEQPVVSGTRGKNLSITAGGGELLLEESQGTWNCASSGRRLLELCRNAVIKEFSLSDGAFLLSINRILEDRTWTFRLRNMKGKRLSDDRCELIAQVYRSGGDDRTWERGSLRAELGFDPFQYSFAFQAYSFPGAAELCTLFAPDIRGLRCDGIGDLEITGAYQKKRSRWEAQFRAAGLSMTFPGTGIVLKDLAGLVLFHHNEISWSSLSGTIGGAEVRAEGTLRSRSEEDYVALTIPSVRLSAAWFNLFTGDVYRSFFSRFQPEGTVQGTMFMKDLQILSRETVTGTFSGEKVSLGGLAALHAVELKGDMIARTFKRGTMRWERMEFAGIPSGGGKLEISRDDDGWNIVECVFGFKEGMLTGEGRFEKNAEGRPVLTLHFVPPPLSLSVLMQLLKIKHCFQAEIAGTHRGTVDVFYDASGFIVLGTVKLRSARLREFLQGPQALFSENEEAGYAAGLLDFRFEAATLQVRSAVFVSAAKVLVMKGGLTAGGNADLQLLVLERGDVPEETLFAGTASDWPLTATQRDTAQLFRLTGDITKQPAESVEEGVIPAGF